MLYFRSMYKCRAFVKCCEELSSSPLFLNSNHVQFVVGLWYLDNRMGVENL